MAFPALSEYQSTIQHPQIAFLDPDLRVAKVETRPNGMPWPRAGGFALTYKLESPTRTWAVRCFHKDAPGIDLRYRDISRFLNSVSPPRFVDFSYLPSQILVQGQRYPVVKMDWIEGVSLESHVGKVRSNSKELQKTIDEIRSTIRFLEQNHSSHGDLQHGNILIGKSGAKFIDYDGMYVPGMVATHSNEVGHVNYQSPQRTGDDFGPGLDRFSGIVICLTLEALQSDPTLWDRYNVGDNLLFQRKDFLAPSNSDLFQELSSKTEFQQRADRLAALCTVPLSQLPTVDQFFQGSFTVSSLPKTRALGVTHARLHQHDIISARERQELLNRVGDVVQVVGKVVNTTINSSRTGQPYAFIDFGPWKYKHFRLILWSSTLARFREEGIDVKSYEGQWITVIGMVEEWDETPQIVIDDPQDIREISGGESQANRLLKENNQQVTVADPQTGGATTNQEILDRIRSTGTIGDASGARPPSSAGVSSQIAPAATPGAARSRNQEALERIRRQQSGSASAATQNSNASATTSNITSQVGQSSPAFSTLASHPPAPTNVSKPSQPPTVASQPTSRFQVSIRSLMIGLMVFFVVLYLLFH